MYTHFTSQHTPSAYLAEMRMTTEERLATITEMYPPTITELLDIATSSNHKVSLGKLRKSVYST